MADDLLARLLDAIGDPWCRSLEGLDDCCHLCRCDRREWIDGAAVRQYGHEPDCPWVAAMAVLGRSIDDIDGTRHYVHSEA